MPERRKKKNSNATPGPGSYDIGGLARYTGGSSTRSPGWGFGTASRSGKGTLGFAGLESPGPATYDVRGTSYRDGGSNKRWTPNSHSFPGSPNRPSPFKDQRSPGPIYYYPDCEHDSDHTTTAKFSIERTNHNQGVGRIGTKTIGPGPSYNLRNGKACGKQLAIGDVTHKTSQRATCGKYTSNLQPRCCNLLGVSELRPLVFAATRPATAKARMAGAPGPATYDSADMNKCSMNSEQAPSFTMGQWVPFGGLPMRPAPAGKGKVLVPEPGIGPKYDVGAKTGGKLANKADPPSISFGKDERFWDDDLSCAKHDFYCRKLL